jgi:hypothetical protein
LVIKDSIGFFKRFGFWFSRDGCAAMAKEAGELEAVAAALEEKLKALSGPLADYLFAPMPVDGETLIKQLALLQLRLSWMQLPEGEGGRRGPEQDRKQDYCAVLARNLMKQFSTLSITGTAEGPYRVTASLVYEALTGEAGKDLKRACDRALGSDVT